MARQRKQERRREERRRDSSPAKLSAAQALEILGLKAGATEQEIRAAYTRLMKRVHPDFGESNFFATQLNPHSPDNVLSFRRDLRDSDIAISSLFWIARGGDGEPDG